MVLLHIIARLLVIFGYMCAEEVVAGWLRAFILVSGRAACTASPSSQVRTARNLSGSRCVFLEHVEYILASLVGQSYTRSC
jgi:hypothetical protein